MTVLLAAIGLLLGTVATAPVALAAPSTKLYAASASPTTLSLGASGQVDITLANDPTSNQSFGSASLTLGGTAGDSVEVVGVSAEDGATGWTATTTLSGGSTVILITSPSNTGGVTPGSSLVVTVTLTPHAVTAIPVTTEVKQSNDFNGNNNDFALTTADPTLQVDYQLAFTQQPPSVLTVSTLSPKVAYTYTCPAVQVEDASGQAVDAAGIPITLSFTGANPGLYYGTTAVPSSGVVAYTGSTGSATFGTSGCATGLGATQPGTGYALMATGPGAAAPATSSSFSVGYQLLFSQEPPAVVQVSGSGGSYAMAPTPTVQLADGLGNPVSAPGKPITLGYATAAGNPGLAVCSPTVTTDSNGTSVFGPNASGCLGVTASNPGDGYRLSASTSVPGSTTATSTPFDVGFQLRFATEPPAAVQQSVPPKSFSYLSSGGQPVTVQVDDLAGSPIPAGGVPVTLTSDPSLGDPGLYFAGAPVGSGGVSVTTDSSGQAVFTTLAATNLGAGYELVASASGTSTDSTPFSVAQSVTSCPATGTCTSPTVTSALQGTTGSVTSTASDGSSYSLSLSFGEGLGLTCDSQVSSGPYDPLVISTGGPASGYVTLDFTKAVMNSVTNNGASQMPVCSGATQEFYGATQVQATPSPTVPYIYQGLLADCSDPGYLADNSPLQMCVYNRSRLPGGGEQVVVYQSSLTDPMHF
ncbi:MAG TPA: hypothetical protein VFN60_03270 [Acidimicrobiales bacterium]|nr:hypothetical protein [Acidimicrobiales bacterium]